MEKAHTCGELRANGEPCANRPQTGASTCWAHSPENGERRSENARKAAKAKASKSYEVVRVKDTLLRLANDLRAGKVSRGDASVLSQIYGTILRAFEQERRVRETEEIIARVQRVEELQKSLQSRNVSRLY